MNLPTLQPKRAWQMVLDQLRAEMSVASFSTWVKDTEFVSFENGLFTIGAANAYGCEWLTSRLTSTVSRLLAGMLSQPVGVQFVVHDLSAVYEDDVDKGIKEEILDKGKPPEELTLQAEYQSIYDEIVQPDQVIVVPGYFLRYIPMLGMELAWLYVGFRQAAYEAGASKKPGKKVSAPAKKVAYYAGMSPRSFWRWAARPTTWERLRWLVKPVEETPKWNRGNDGRPHQATRSYRVSMTMPLTPFDELSLRAWLFRKLAEGNGPLNILQAALETPVEELLPWPEKVPSLEDTAFEPHSVRDVVLEACSPVPEGEKSQLNELTEKLAQHLMPSKDLVFLTHYFVSHWLARLGPGPGWFVTMMRDRCYLNQRTGETRDEVRLEGGYAEAARWLGLKRVKTIWEWLRADDVAIFLRETGRENGSWEEAPRRIKVCLGEPMTDEDQDQANALLAKSPIGASVIHSDPVVIDSIGANGTHREMNNRPTIGASCSHEELNYGNADSASGTHNEVEQGHAVGASVTHSNVDPDPSIGASCKDGKHPVGVSDSHSNGNPEPSIGASCKDEKQPIGASDSHNGAIDSHKIGASGTLIGASDTHKPGASGTIDWRDWHSLNSLTPGFKHLKNSQTTPANNDGSDSENADTNSQKRVVAGVWKISDLLSLNRISAKNQDHLLEKGITSQAFISWLLYAASKGGSSIRNPVGHAISRLAPNPAKGAGGACDRLAGLPASELADLIQREIAGQSPWNPDWRMVMEGVPLTRLRALADQLGIPAPDSDYR